VACTLFFGNGFGNGGQVHGNGGQVIPTSNEKTNTQ
jgi:hypothetical protein